MTTVEPTPGRPEPLVSLVIPVFDEQEVLPLLFERLRGVLDTLAGGAEVWFVNDGSRDGSLQLLQTEARRDPRLRVIDLARNFGHSAAITAGLDHAEGDVVVVMDADLQDPPEVIPLLVARYREGFDVVHARRTARRNESVFKRLSARLFYYLMELAAQQAPERDVGEFRLINRPVVKELRRFGEQHRLMRGLVKWVGFRQTTIDFERPGRAAGVTKFPLTRMLRLSWDAITSFSVAPLRLATLLGFGTLAGGAVYGGWLAYAAAALGVPTPVWAPLAVLQLLLMGAVLICVGLLGEYVGRIFEEVKGRPLYVVRSTQAPTGDPPERAGADRDDRPVA